MTTLAHAYRPRERAAAAVALYEEFRPAVPEGVPGRGAKGMLDLRLIRSLATRWNPRRWPQATDVIRAAFPGEKAGGKRGPQTGI